MVTQTIYATMSMKRSIKYKEEREAVCDKLIEILNLDENNSILLYDLENDIEKQQAILDMKDEIKKYFAVSCLTPFKPNKTCKRPYINIIRGILRQQGYLFQGSNISFKDKDNKLSRTMKYIIFRTP